MGFVDPEGLAGGGPRRWYPDLPIVIGGKGGNLNPNMPWKANVNPSSYKCIKGSSKQTRMEEQEWLRDAYKRQGMKDSKTTRERGRGMIDDLLEYFNDLFGGM